MLESRPSMCQSEELNIVRGHLRYIVDLLIAPDFKEMVNWCSLTKEQVSVESSALEQPNVRNFVILSALKI